MFNLCRYLKEESGVKKEELKNMFGTSFKRAVDLRYIIKKEELYYITNSGLTYLANYKVDNALIIALDFPSKFVPFTFDKPQGLLEVKGEIIVERQIRQLKDIGINDITIIAGYLGEQFRYLTHKFGVKLIINSDNSKYSILSSIKLVKKKLKNTYIITADLYLEDHVLHENEKNSWYGAIFNKFLEKSNYPAFDENNKFIGIKTRKPKDQWILKGPIFLNDETSNLIKEDLKDSTSNFNEFFSDILKKSSIEILEIKEHDVFVLDSLESLRSFDRSYSSKGKHPTLDLIGEVFQVEQDDIYDISMMKKGMTNNSFLFTVDDLRYVFRVPGKGTNVLINRGEEARVYDAIKDLNISDEIFYIDSENGYKITRYYETIRNLNVNNMDEVTKAIDLIRMLHDNEIVVPHSFDLKERTNYYKKNCDKVNASFYDGFDDVYLKIKSLFDHIVLLERPNTLCHIDPIGDNFLVLEDGSLRLIDWEYSGMSDPLLDIAMFSISAKYDDVGTDQILELYKKGKVTKEERFIYYSYIAIGSFIWTLWTNYKEAVGEDSGDYGIKQFNYSKRYIEKSLNLKDEIDKTNIKR